MTFGRLPTFAAIVAAGLFIAATLHHSRDNLKVPEAIKSWTFQKPRPSFYEVALRHGTDKVIEHSYHNMYEKYLPLYRDKHFKMLEIGLGCDMGYGPGKSYYAWLEYFPHVDLYYIEYDAACAKKWAANTTGATIFAGDQGDVAFLERFIDEANADTDPFDIIVDDGGHHMAQQITSLKHLWKAVKPGGMYFCEDLQTSYQAYWGGDPTAVGSNNMIGVVKELLDDLHGFVGQKYDFSTDLLGMDCMREICAWTKKKASKMTVGAPAP